MKLPPDSRWTVLRVERPGGHANSRHETDMWFPAFIAGFVADPIGSVENAPRSVRSIVRTLVEE